MCSQSEDYVCDLEPKSKVYEKNAYCIKCKKFPNIKVRSDDPALCRSCFLDNCIHKINAVFGKNRLCNSQTNIAVAYSGGLYSSALLQLIIESFKLNKNQKWKFYPKIFHLVDSSVADLDEIKVIMQKSGFEYYIVDLGNDYNINCDDYEICKNSSNFTSQEQLEKWMFNLKLVHCARKIDCKYLMLGECASRVATNFLMGVIEGRGNFSCSQTTFYDRRYGDISIIRPLNELLSKEIVYFVKYMQLKTLTKCYPLTEKFIKCPNATSLERLTQDFLNSLHVQGFPSTFGAILRTSSKLVSLEDQKAEDHTEYCAFCMDPLTKFESDIDNYNKLAQASLKHSHSLSQGKLIYVEENTLNVLAKQKLCSSCLAMRDDLIPSAKSNFDKFLFNE